MQVYTFKVGPQTWLNALFVYFSCNLWLQEHVKSIEFVTKTLIKRFGMRKWLVERSIIFLKITN